MRLSLPFSIASIGQLEIRGLQRVIELEATEPSFPSKKSAATSQAVYPTAVHAIQSRSAIVVPCKDEPLERIQSVWAAIPSSSLIILVSASEPDTYARERTALAAFCRETDRNAMCINQRDPVLAEALRSVGMTTLLSDDGLVHKGKGEALVVGIALAATASCPADGGRTHQPYKYVGFLDADNLVPGSVQEYCRAYSAGLHLASTEDAMVRISWGSKPKIKDGGYDFKHVGRTTRIVNRWFNRLLLAMGRDCTITGEVAESAENEDGQLEMSHICTGCPGENAMSLSLALKLRLASGYAVEVFHYLDIMERFAGLAGSSIDNHSTLTTSSALSPGEGPIRVSSTPLAPFSAAPGSGGVQILQIRTLNPHFHDDRGGDHITRMWQQCLSVIYQSPAISHLHQYRRDLRSAIFQGNASLGTNGPTQQNQKATGAPVVEPPPDYEPAPVRIYPALSTFDLSGLRARLEDGSFWWSGMNGI